MFRKKTIENYHDSALISISSTQDILTGLGNEVDQDAIDMGLITGIQKGIENTSNILHTLKEAGAEIDQNVLSRFEELNRAVGPFNDANHEILARNNALLTPKSIPAEWQARKLANPKQDYIEKNPRPPSPDSTPRIPNKLKK